MRTLLRSSVGLALALTLSAPASAQVVQSLQVGFGAFLPRGFDSRVAGDVLVENLTSIEPLRFEIGNFRSAQIFGEWNVAFGDHVEVGAGIGYYGRRVPSVYRSLVNANGREIEQDLRLRIVPVQGVVRFMPFGRLGEFQPYVGAGLGLLTWRYTESGEFVDTFTYDIFEARYVATGTDVGAVLLGGLRVPIRGDIYAMTLELRYQFGSGDTGGTGAGFLNDKIDLSGANLNFGFLIRF
jgi:hypothetical protein